MKSYIICLQKFMKVKKTLPEEDKTSYETNIGNINVKSLDNIIEGSDNSIEENYVKIQNVDKPENKNLGKFRTLNNLKLRVSEVTEVWASFGGNLINYWDSTADIGSELAKVAMHIHNICVNLALVERFWSSMGFLYTNQQNKLKSKKMLAMNDNLNNPESSNLSENDLQVNDDNDSDIENKNQDNNRNSFK
ncbi:hypothetical protein C1645_814139 [Glomus cerebriforme]|uniref:Uncharacterized protein n=1 Tax=Glomus cerebriforme TaxID=658196 RepID=A0A397TJ72_9GLOM|nr:hypothetical protein C1645_814139 [Glomus cerebriforme]